MKTLKIASATCEIYLRNFQIFSYLTNSAYQELMMYNIDHPLIHCPLDSWKNVQANQLFAPTPFFNGQMTTHLPGCNNLQNQVLQNLPFLSSYNKNISFYNQ